MIHRFFKFDIHNSEMLQLSKFLMASLSVCGSIVSTHLRHAPGSVLTWALSTIPDSDRRKVGP